MKKRAVFVRFNQGFGFKCLMVVEVGKLIVILLGLVDISFCDWTAWLGFRCYCLHFGIICEFQLSTAFF